MILIQLTNAAQSQPLAIMVNITQTSKPAFSFAQKTIIITIPHVM